VDEDELLHIGSGIFRRPVEVEATQDRGLAGGGSGAAEPEEGTTDPRLAQREFALPRFDHGLVTSREVDPPMDVKR
jgi:hypothetical protein